LPSLNTLNASFLEQFANLSDPRIERSKEHLLKDTIAIVILAVISDADGWVGIEAYLNAKYECLKSFLKLPNGIHLMTHLVQYLPEFNPSSFKNVF
jgi:DDE_Tnp_1-associated